MRFNITIFTLELQILIAMLHVYDQSYRVPFPITNHYSLTIHSRRPRYHPLKTSFPRVYTDKLQ
jgi:hypothetical protein